MGQMLSEPITAKESAFCQNEKYLVGSSCMQGWRVHMEDAHTHILALPDDQSAAFFAVYDGHGGAGIALYAGQNMHKILVKRPEYPTNIAKAMKMAYLEIDEIMYADDVLQNAGGSTALSCLIKDNKLYCANAGDSRMMACVDGNIEVLSIDHKPNDKIELDRIIKAGGFVQYNRVNGTLSLSRALGDFRFKLGGSEMAPEDQVITANPDVEVRELTEDWEFAVLACDGIWDVMSNWEIRNFCRERIALGLHPDKICEQLINHCLAPDCRMGGRGSDNMTVILVLFLHNRPYKELSARCATIPNDMQLGDFVASEEGVFIQELSDEEQESDKGKSGNQSTESETNKDGAEEEKDAENMSKTLQAKDGTTDKKTEAKDESTLDLK